MSDNPVAIDRDELRLLRATAREVFAGMPTLATLGELGLLALLTPEENGGAGWRVLEACTVVREAGRALNGLPVGGTLLAAAAVAGYPDQEALLDDLLGGRTGGAFHEHRDLARDGDGWTATGAVVVSGTLPLGGLVLAGEDEQDDVPLLLITPGPADASALAGDDRLDTTRDELLVDLSRTPVHPLRAPAAGTRLLADTAALLVCADTLGALEVTAERVREYLAGRTAFGRPLASFQALQHRLTDLEVLVAAADALVQRAAVALARRAPSAHGVTRLLRVFLAERAVAALDDCIQLCGGIGFTWEWPVHHAMRRAVRNAAAARPRLLDPEALRASLDGSRPSAATNDAFRARVRDVVSRHAPFETREGHRAPKSAEQEAAMRSWYRTLYDNGLLGRSWPVEWGGSPDHQPLDELVLTEELIRARAPRPIDQVLLASHVLLRHGTDEQRKRYLPGIRTGEYIWCQLFSEPGAGSDLAGVTARATAREDGTWVLSGQKTWTTDGHWAQYGMALLRTDPASERHAGLTVFIVPMDSPGLEIRPMTTMGGAHEFNDVFLDGVVLGPEHVIGEIGRGWSVSMSGLESERFTVGGNVLLLELLLADLITVAGAVGDGGETVLHRPETLERITRLRSEAEAANAYVTGHIERALAGEEGEAEAPIAKLLYTEAYNRTARLGVQVITQHQPVPEHARAAARRLTDAYLWSRSLTISGGSSEVMRNIIGKRRLRLPSGR
ncbi:acyl-CoA dehydrogenase family protein [Streptomyces sp. NPDC057363]|uniref:acyl-CoA dehydrogenase family protein n=1 Tax=Streptomyces sp. NPDC057363 TaxID=3346107 RepID=UPI00362EC2BB